MRMMKHPKEEEKKKKKGLAAQDEGQKKIKKYWYSTAQHSTTPLHSHFSSFNSGIMLVLFVWTRDCDGLFAQEVGKRESRVSRVCCMTLRERITNQEFFSLFIVPFV